MDNDDKVTKALKKTTSLFLSDIKQDMGSKELYDLDTEFAKTKKNKKVIIWLSVVLFITVMTIAALAVTQYIQWRSNNIPINIAAFNDANLSDVLNKAKEYEQELEIALRKRNDLIAEKEQMLSTIQQELEQQIQIVNSKNISNREKTKQIDKLQSEALEASAAVEAEFDQLIAVQDAEIAQIEEKIDSYDSRMLEQAREQEQVLDNQRALFNIEMQSKVDYYEEKIVELNDRYEAELEKQQEYIKELTDTLNDTTNERILAVIKKYNPEFSSEEINAILDREFAETGEIEDLLSISLPEILYQNGALTEEILTTNLELIGETVRIYERLNDVPYENSIPASLIYLQNAYKAMIMQYIESLGMGAEALKAKDGVIASKDSVIAARNQTIASRNSTIRNKDNQLGQFHYALDSLVSGSRETGYVIDPRNPGEILIYIDSIYEVSSGDLGYVFRNDNDFIGTITLTADNGIMTAAVKDLADTSRNIEPYDKILIELGDN